MCTFLFDVFLIVLSVIFPPLPVWIRRGICSCDSFINILLCCLGYLPGLIHSWYIIASHPPYPPRGDTSIYYVYRSDLENQTARRPQECHLHVHNESLRQEPLATAAPQFQSYGATNQGAIQPAVFVAAAPVTPHAPSQAEAPSAEPPKYSEYDSTQGPNI